MSFSSYDTRTTVLCLKVGNVGSSDKCEQKCLLTTSHFSAKYNEVRTSIERV